MPNIGEHFQQIKIRIEIISMKNGDMFAKQNGSDVKIAILWQINQKTMATKWDATHATTKNHQMQYYENQFELALKKTQKKMKQSKTIWNRNLIRRIIG